MKRIAIGLIAGVAVVSVLLALAVVLGGPQPPPPMESINAPFRSVDLSDLALLKRYTARDGARLAFRAYAPTASPAKGSAVLIHGSSASSSSLHPLAKGLAQAGYAVYALDMRGHGESGPKGQITYIGQLEDDVEDFLEAVQPAGPRTLVGFSSGGGFALRFAASLRQQPFDQYVLLAPFIHRDAPTYRPGSGGWVAAGVARIIALTFLNRFGITRFNTLPVLAFALTAEAQQFLTPTYSYALEKNFRAHDDYRADIGAAKQPLHILVGQDDEVLHADQFSAVFEEAGRPVPVTLLPGVEHVDIILQPAAIQAITETIESFRDGESPESSQPRCAPSSISRAWRRASGVISTPPSMRASSWRRSR